MISRWDRISELPEEILVCILSFLTPKEAARTSVLSRKWRYLWTFFIGHFLFNQNEWQMNWSQLATRINHIMKLHRGMSLEGFTVDFGKVDSVEDIDHWIEFAAKKRVKKLQLIFGSTRIGNPGRCFMTIQLRANLNFESLKVLWLVKVNLREGAALNHMLSSTPNLEELCLRDLDGLSGELLVPTSCIKLKVLHVLTCDPLNKLEIFATSIEEFRLIGFEVDIKIKELHQLILPIFQLKELTLDLWTWLDVKQFSLPELDFLRLAIVASEGDEMISWMYLLEAAPVLHTLEIYFCWESGFIQRLATFDMHRMQPNRCIKVVKMVQFVGLTSVDFEIAKTVIKYLESLGKLIIVPYSEAEGPEMPILTAEMKKQMEDNIAQLREKEFLPSTVELVIERGF
ncbi:hypothetical protein CDL12_11462 [Handroanthus impetiginosus]|uniref:F-box domain-containing protein n=1 Tax=Handroanthus impetiginosus TaxID=429701 RepID=A0A2G9HEE5_9LAMI|nr:hypothetical protein CDL12_11462 [Handroanthus impetiginosus]